LLTHALVPVLLWGCCLFANVVLLYLGTHQVSPFV
jgi:hypothetical protein